MKKRDVLKAAVVAAAMLCSGAGFAQETIKIGLILPMTGPSASTGRQIEAAVKLYQQLNGNTVAGKKVEIILKDDTGVADVTKRLAQELLVNEKVNALAGFGLTPLALAVAPLATQAKVPQVVMAAASSVISGQSPYIVRTSFTLTQVTNPMAEWAAANKIKKVVTLVTDYAPGIEAQKAFRESFTKAGGEVVAELQAPLRSPEFAPYLQRARDASPDAMFLFVPSGQGAALMRQVAEREFSKAGIQVIATGDVTDDDQLNDMGDVVSGMITTHHFSAAHNSPVNKAFVEAFRKANPTMRPNFMAVGGYDGMHVLYKAIEKVGNATDGAALMEAMKGLSWESPRGKITIDPTTRDVTQNVYVRKVEKVDGQLYNVEFSTIEAVKAAK
jgi:branched-chain amino acid transport system substrate-binding protein